MILTKIEYLPDGSAVLYIDEEKSAVIDAAEVSALHLSTEMELDGRLLSKIRALSRRYNARKRAFASVARGDLSKKALMKKLSEKGIDKTNAAEAAEFMEKRGYINDSTLALRIVQAYGAEKCFGRRRVEQELWKRGIPNDVAEAALEEMPADEELISGLYEQRFLRQDIRDPKIKKRVFDALLRYGYGFEDIRRELAKRGSTEEDE